MKRILVVFGLALALMSASSNVYGQYRKGDKLLNLGFGLNSAYNGGTPFCASFEVGVTDDISFGGGLDYLSSHYSAPPFSYGFTAIYIGARGSYHFSKLLNIRNDKWDIYGGASLGYRSFSWSDNYSYTSGSYGSGIFLGIHAGVRYYFAPKVGAFFELGALGSSNLRLGVAFKF